LKDLKRLEDLLRRLPLARGVIGDLADQGEGHFILLQTSCLEMVIEQENRRVYHKPVCPADGTD